MKKIYAIAVACLLISSHLQARLANTAFGTVVPIETLNSYTKGPVDVAPGIVWTATSTSAMFGYKGTVDFHSNGIWRDLPAVTSVDDDESTMEYRFDPPVSGVGGLLNYVPDAAQSKRKPVIAIYDKNHKIIDSNILSFKSPSGRGEFRGFQLNTPRIVYFSLSYGFVSLRDLTVQKAPLPPMPKARPAQTSLQGSTAILVQVGFPATRCKSLRMTPTQRRHCDKAMRKAASKV